MYELLLHGYFLVLASTAKRSISTRRRDSASPNARSRSLTARRRTKAAHLTGKFGVVLLPSPCCCGPVPAHAARPTHNTRAQPPQPLSLATSSHGPPLNPIALLLSERHACPHFSLTSSSLPIADLPFFPASRPNLLTPTPTSTSRPAPTTDTSTLSTALPPTTRPPRLTFPSANSENAPAPSSRTLAQVTPARPSPPSTRTPSTDAILRFE